MSTAQLTASRAPVSALAEGARSRTRPALPAVLAGALLAIITYAAFAHGGVALGTDTRLQLGVTALAAIALIAWLWTGTMRLRAPRTTAYGIGLLAAFAAWSGVTVLWSVAPDQTWLELNRVLTYTLVVLLAVAIGASYARALEVVALGFLAVAGIVTAYALGQKLVPGLHIPGLFNLDQASPLPRLQEPLGYWNALGVFLALAVPVALAVAGDATRPRGLRITALCALDLMLLAVVLTYSRGALLALGIGLAVAVALGAERLRSVMWLGVAVVAVVPGLVVGLTLPALTQAGVELGRREVAGGILAAVLALSLIALAFAARRLFELEVRVRIAPERVAGVRRRLVLGAVGAVIALIVALAVTGVLADAWHSFTATRAASNYDPGRLLSADSENRWVWWKEAAGAFSDRPLGGWGAGSFAVVHLLYRHDSLTVQQPHSVPMQFLAETGIIGALLGLSALALLLTGAARAARLRPPGTSRRLAGALLAGGVIYAVHTLYDWDWEIPAVTLPALLFLGVLAGAGGRAPASPTVGRRPGGHGFGLAALTLWLAILGLSIEVPERAAAQAGSGLVQASGASPEQLQQALAAGDSASSLDPLSDAGLRVEATVAYHLGQVSLAQRYLQQAVQRQPSDVEDWAQLAYVDLRLGDRAGSAQAAEAVLQLDPRGSLSVSLVRAHLLDTPPGHSPSRYPTPLRLG